MSDAAALVRRLFSPPGGSAASTELLVVQAAAAHAGLLERACAHDPDLGRSLAPLREFLRGPASPTEKRRLLVHPLFIEGLHGLAPCSAELRRWHDRVTAAPAPPDPAARASLGNVALVCALRAGRGRDGEFDLCADVLGRVGFPFSDWTLTLYTDRDDFLARQAVTLTLEHDRACWRLADSPEPPFLVMSREDCLRLVVDNDDTLERGRLEFPHPHMRPRLQCAHRLGRSAVRYDPVAFENFRGHAPLTGGLVERLLAAVRRHSPGVYREFRSLMHVVRGYEFPTSALGVVGSFSDPTLPGVMGFNVPFSPRHEPCIDPFCFTWFGHELGHTKDYLIDTVLDARGLALARNLGDRTGPLPRYGRPLSVRTLLQVPYVHLYEWALLMDFWEAGFRGLPWRVPADAAEAGEDLAAEIREAFALIPECARLTAEGEAVLGHFRDLFARAAARWHSLRVCGCP
jgi:hypothetical protein